MKNDHTVTARVERFTSVQEGVKSLLCPIAISHLLCGVEEDKIEDSMVESAKQSVQMARAAIEEEQAMVLNMFRTYQGGKKELLPFDAEQLAEFLPDDLDRFRHLEGVTKKMEEILLLLPVELQEKAYELTQSIYLLDIWRSPQSKHFHYPPIRAAIFAMISGFPRHVVAAVLFQSVEQMALAKSIPLFDRFYEEAEKCLTDDDRLSIRLFAYCDLLTGPGGEPVTFEEKYQEISDLYGADHAVTRYLIKQEPEFRLFIKEVEALTK